MQTGHSIGHGIGYAMEVPGDVSVDNVGFLLEPEQDGEGLWGWMT
jgi:hypothetical protein